jgi:hypothetical protein
VDTVILKQRKRCHKMCCSNADDSTCRHNGGSRLLEAFKFSVIASSNAPWYTDFKACPMRKSEDKWQIYIICFTRNDNEREPGDG